MNEHLESPEGEQIDGAVVNSEADKSAAIGATWRNVFKIHPACAILPPISPDELKTLGEDIKRNGLRESIKYVLYNRHTQQYADLSQPGVQLSQPGDDDVDLILIDGSNRLDGMEMVGVRVPTTFDEFDKFPDSENLYLANDAEIVRYIISANIRRRHLSGKDRDRLIGELLKLDPSKSDRQIGRETNADHKTVGAVRTNLEATGEIPQLEKRVGKDGKSRKRRARNPARPQRPPAPPPPPEPAPATKPSTPPPAQFDFFAPLPAAAPAAPQRNQRQSWEHSLFGRVSEATSLTTFWDREFPGWQKFDRSEYVIRAACQAAAAWAKIADLLKERPTDAAS